MPDYRAIFDGTGGRWVDLTHAFSESTIYWPTDTTGFQLDELAFGLDTVITLYDPTREQIAENDDSVPRVNTDSEIVIQLPTTGTYYLLVQEWTVWAGEALEDALTGPYQLDVVLVEPADPAVAIDPRNGRDVISAE